MRQQYKKGTMEVISSISDIRDTLADGLAYCDENVTIIDRVQSIGAGITTMKVDTFVIALCLKGHASFCMNSTSHDICECQMFVCHPTVVLENTMISADFECCGIAFSADYIRRIDLALSENWNLRMLLERYPIVRLNPSEVETYMLYYKLLRKTFLDPPRKYRNELVFSIIQSFSYDFHHVQERVANCVQPGTFSSAEKLFAKFVNMLESYAPRERRIAFYADKLCVTPKYLSSVCKARSGHTASELINSFVVKEIAFWLKQTDKSIKEIASDMDFANLSFFGKYVKANLGMSPKQYRQKHISIYYGQTAGDGQTAKP